MGLRASLTSPSRDDDDDDDGDDDDDDDDDGDDADDDDDDDHLEGLTRLPSPWVRPTRLIPQGSPLSGTVFLIMMITSFGFWSDVL